MALALRVFYMVSLFHPLSVNQETLHYPTDMDSDYPAYFIIEDEVNADTIIVNGIKYKKVAESLPQNMRILTSGEADCVEYNNQEFVRMRFFNASGEGWWIRGSDGNVLSFICDPRQESVLEGAYQKCKSEKVGVKESDDERIISTFTEAWYNAADWLMESKDQKTLYEICKEWNDDDDNPPVSALVERVEAWLPKEQSAAGSQNAYVECTVEGFNDCLHKIKSRLR